MSCMGPPRTRSPGRWASSTSMEESHKEPKLRRKGRLFSFARSHAPSPSPSLPTPREAAAALVAASPTFRTCCFDASRDNLLPVARDLAGALLASSSRPRDRCLQAPPDDPKTCHREEQLRESANALLHPAGSTGKPTSADSVALFDSTHEVHQCNSTGTLKFPFSASSDTARASISFSETSEASTFPDSCCSFRSSLSSSLSPDDVEAPAGAGEPHLALALSTCDAIAEDPELESKFASQMLTCRGGKVDAPDADVSASASPVVGSDGLILSGSSDGSPEVQLSATKSADVVLVLGDGQAGVRGTFGASAEAATIPSGSAVASGFLAVDADFSSSDGDDIISQKSRDTAGSSNASHPLSHPHPCRYNVIDLRIPEAGPASCAAVEGAAGTGMLSETPRQVRSACTTPRDAEGQKSGLTILPLQRSASLCAVLAAASGPRGKPEEIPASSGPEPLASGTSCTPGIQDSNNGGHAGEGQQKEHKQVVHGLQLEKVLGDGDKGCLEADQSTLSSDVSAQHAKGLEGGGKVDMELGVHLSKAKPEKASQGLYLGGARANPVRTMVGGDKSLEQATGLGKDHRGGGQGEQATSLAKPWGGCSEESGLSSLCRILPDEVLAGNSQVSPQNVRGHTVKSSEGCTAKTWLAPRTRISLDEAGGPGDILCGKRGVLEGTGSLREVAPLRGPDDEDPGSPCSMAARSENTGLSTIRIFQEGSRKMRGASTDTYSLAMAQKGHCASLLNFTDMKGAQRKSESSTFVYRKEMRSLIKDTVRGLPVGSRTAAQQKQGPSTASCPGKDAAQREGSMMASCTENDRVVADTCMSQFSVLLPLPPPVNQSQRPGRGLLSLPGARKSVIPAFHAAVSDRRSLKDSDGTSGLISAQSAVPRSFTSASLVVPSCPSPARSWACGYPRDLTPDAGFSQSIFRGGGELAQLLWEGAEKPMPHASPVAMAELQHCMCKPAQERSRPPLKFPLESPKPAEECQAQSSTQGGAALPQVLNVALEDPMWRQGVPAQGADPQGCSGCEAAVQHCVVAEADCLQICSLTPAQGHCMSAEGSCEVPVKQNAHRCQGCDASPAQSAQHGSRAHSAPHGPPTRTCSAQAQRMSSQAAHLRGTLGGCEGEAGSADSLGWPLKHSSVDLAVRASEVKLRNDQELVAAPAFVSALWSREDWLRLIHVAEAGLSVADKLGIESSEVKAAASLMSQLLKGGAIPSSPEPRNNDSLGPRGFPFHLPNPSSKFPPACVMDVSSEDRSTSIKEHMTSRSKENQERNSNSTPKRPLTQRNTDSMLDGGCARIREPNAGKNCQGQQINSEVPFEPEPPETLSEAEGDQDSAVRELCRSNGRSSLGAFQLESMSPVGPLACPHLSGMFRMPGSTRESGEEHSEEAEDRPLGGSGDQMLEQGSPVSAAYPRHRQAARLGDRGDAEASVPAETSRKLRVMELAVASFERLLADDSASGIHACTFLLEKLLELTAASMGFIASLQHHQDGTNYLRTHAITNVGWTRELRQWYEDNKEAGLVFSNMNSLFGEVVRTGDVVISNSPLKDPRYSGIPPGHPLISSFLGVPLIEGDKLIGVISLANRVGGLGVEGFESSVVDEIEPLVRVATHVLSRVAMHCDSHQDPGTDIDSTASGLDIDSSFDPME